MISRDEVLRRARTLWPAGTVPYSQSTIHGPTGYRQDCSGFLSMCWGIPLQAGGWGGLSTVTLVSGGWIREIPASDLQPGDAVGICGPGSAGDAGHIVLFEKWITEAEDESRYWLYEQAGGRSGPVHRMTSYPYGGPTGAWRAYRFRDIIDTPGGNMADDYGVYGKPASVGNRPLAVLIADLWGQEMGESSPYASNAPSVRSKRLASMERKLDAALTELQTAREEIAALRLGGVDVVALAAAIAPLLPAAPTLAEIATAVANEHARRARE